jgi:ketosteroid isomerase-like protein
MANRQVIGRIVDAWNRGDRSALIESFDEDIVWYALPGNPDYTEPVHGRAAALEQIDEWLAPWSRYTVETLELAELGDAVVWTARHGASQDQTGPTLEVPMSAVITFRDGRIAEARFFSERGAAVGAAGRLLQEGALVV